MASLRPRAAPEIGSLLPWWHEFILRKYPEVRSHRKWTHLVCNRFWGSPGTWVQILQLPSPSNSQTDIPMSQLPWSLPLGFFDPDPNCACGYKFALHFMCLHSSCFYFLMFCAYYFLSALIFYAALLSVLPSLCFTFKHSTGRSDWVSSSLSRKGFIY